MFDLHNSSTGFDQRCPLDPGKSCRWVLRVKAKAFVYMLRASASLCIIRVIAQMDLFFFSNCMCLFDVQQCCMCLISRKRV